MDALPRYTLLLLGAVSCSALRAQSTTSLSATAGHLAEQRTKSVGFAATRDVTAAVSAQLLQADSTRKGEVWLEVSAYSRGQPGAVTLRIPLSSTEDAYGESRSCKEGPGGGYEPAFTAGLDEKNFASFRPSAKPQDFHFSLNKYLCRALAVPYSCFGHKVRLPGDWSKWELGAVSFVQLSSSAPSRLSVSPVAITSTDKLFDPAKCAVIAPSNGMCCVQHKTTEWHCGGTPAGKGWHQVSGDCFHRETGGICAQ